MRAAGNIARHSPANRVIDATRASGTSRVRSSAKENLHNSFRFNAHATIMALFSLQGIISVVLIYAAYIYLTSLLHQQRIRRLAVQHHASLPVFSGSKLPFNCSTDVNIFGARMPTNLGRNGGKIRRWIGTLSRLVEGRGYA